MMGLKIRESDSVTTVIEKTKFEEIPSNPHSLQLQEHIVTTWRLDILRCDM